MLWKELLEKTSQLVQTVSSHSQPPRSRRTQTCSIPTESKRLLRQQRTSLSCLCWATAPTLTSRRWSHNETSWPPSTAKQERLRLQRKPQGTTWLTRITSCRTRWAWANKWLQRALKTRWARATCSPTWPRRPRSNAWLTPPQTGRRQQRVHRSTALARKCCPHLWCKECLLLRKALTKPAQTLESTSMAGTPSRPQPWLW